MVLVVTPSMSPGERCRFCGPLVIRPRWVDGHYHDCPYLALERIVAIDSQDRNGLAKAKVIASDAIHGGPIHKPKLKELDL